MKPTNPKGFTLIEVLVSLCAMAFAFVALWTLHLSSLKVDARTHHETEATFWGNRQLEELRSMAATSAGFSNELKINGNTLKAASTVGGVYSQSMSITPVTPWRKDVRITLTWPEQVKLGDGVKSRVNRTVELSTILTNLELN